jgi:cell wall-associated NlpC family hydrolase
MNAFDPRLTPARADIAADFLAGKVAARAFVAGRKRAVTAAAAPLRRAPAPEAPLDTEALHGEAVTVFDTQDGWAWGQLESDGYVGYLRLDDLGVWTAPTHRVCVPRSFVYPGASIKLPPAAALSLNAAVHVKEMRGDFAMLEGGRCIFAAHLALPNEHAPDFVSVAEKFLHTPYLWGGRTSLGLDCSALIQQALAAAGVSAPRDSDMQEKALGAPLPLEAAAGGLQRGDLVFWKGHAGVMQDSARLLHANGHHMMVVSEPLAAARARIAAKSFGAVTSIRRL